MAIIETLEPMTQTLQNAAAATGNGQIFELQGKYGTLTAYVICSGSATVTFEGSVDGTNYTGIRGVSKSSGIGATTHSGAAATYKLDVAGINRFRARISAFSSGTVTAIATAVPASEPGAGSATQILSGSAVIGKVGIDQTTDNTTNMVRATQATHDNLNLNANLQVNNADNASGNPAFVQLTGSITLTHTTLAVSTATQAALASNASRKYAIFINDSDTTIYLKINASAVANQGIRLNANGGSYEICTANGNLDTRAVNAIHAGTGTKTLLVAEGV